MFNLTNPQVSSPVSLAAFDRAYQDFATDGELFYLPNVGFPTSNSYYHMNETFVMACVHQNATVLYHHALSVLRVLAEFGTVSETI
jgi:hypothetical protein